MELININKFYNKDEIIKELNEKNLFDNKIDSNNQNTIICKGWYIQEFAGYTVKDDNSYTEPTFLIEPINLNIIKQKSSINFEELNINTPEGQEDYLYSKYLDDQGRQTFGSDGSSKSLYIFSMNNNIVEFYNQSDFKKNIEEMCNTLHFHILEEKIKNKTNKVNKNKI